MICFQSCLSFGMGFRITKWDIPNIKAAAKINRGMDSTSGCTAVNPIFVADEADDQRVTKVIPERKLRKGLLELTISF